MKICNCLFLHLSISLEFQWLHLVYPLLVWINWCMLEDITGAHTDPDGLPAHCTHSVCFALGSNGPSYIHSSFLFLLSFLTSNFILPLSLIFQWQMKIFKSYPTHWISVLITYSAYCLMPFLFATTDFYFVFYIILHTFGGNWWEIDLCYSLNLM